MSSTSWMNYTEEPVRRLDETDVCKAVERTLRRGVSKEHVQRYLDAMRCDRAAFPVDERAFRIMTIDAMDNLAPDWLSGGLFRRRAVRGQARWHHLIQPHPERVRHR
jgi:hypothetical protein